MQVSLSLGVLFAVAVAFLKYTRRISWPSLIITFAAGVLLAGSAVGLATRNAAESGSQMVQTGVSAVQDAANNSGSGTGSAKAPPRKVAKQP
jgi:hypothetical protein